MNIVAISSTPRQLAYAQGDKQLHGSANVLFGMRVYNSTLCDSPSST
jgi:hypothetical protein